jgi:methionine transaminase
MTAFRTPVPPSRLPQVGTTIFTVMSALAAEHQAVNLGQGFPDFEGDPRLVDAVAQAMREGHNQYPPMAGLPLLRDAVAAKIEALYGHRYDPATEITVTAGATQAILTAILAVVAPGDEVIVLEPNYDSYVPNIVLAGGTVVRVALQAGSFRPDFDAIAADPGHPGQQPAQPQRHHLARGRLRPAGRDPAPDRRAADLGRGLRAHGLRRRTPRQRVGPP